jgi:two-component system response regulator DesR
VEFDVVEWVEDGHTLVKAAERLSPDVIVTDIEMSGIDGIDAAKLIRRRDPTARIVLITVHNEPVLVEAGVQAGALGCVLKDTAGDDPVAAVRAALEGKRYVSRSFADSGGACRTQNVSG